jgi:hypothetical protein
VKRSNALPEGEHSKVWWFYLGTLFRQERTGTLGLTFALRLYFRHRYGRTSFAIGKLNKPFGSVA